MKKFLEEIKEEKIIHYILILLAAAIAAIPLIKLRIYGTDDGYAHILRILGVDNVIKSGEFPPNIYSKFCRGFGYVINVFYPPLVTYGPLIFKLILNHYYDCLKLYAFVTIIISGFTMYKFIQEVTDRRDISLLASIIYIFIPYRLETIYNRFAIGEFSSYMFLPLVFLGLYNLLKKDGKKHYYITIGAVGLLLSHTITTEYAAIFCVIYVLLNCKALKNKEVIKKIIINIVFILAIASLFIIPLLEYRLYGDYVIFQPNLMYNRGEDVARTTLSIEQLFKDVEPNGVSFKLGPTFVILILLGIFTYRKMNSEYKENYLYFLLIGIISLYILSNFFPWSYMPDILSTMQYAWRMLTFFEFAMAILAAFNLDALITLISKNKKSWLNGLLLLVSIVVIVSTMAKINYDYRYEKAKKYSDDEYEELILSQETISHLSINRDYLPVKAGSTQKEYIKTREMRVYVLSGEANIKNENKNDLNLIFTIENATENTILELPFLYYPGYKVTLNETKLDVFESDYGFITIQLPSDITSAEISVEYTGTIIEKVSYGISFVFTIAFIIYVIYIKRKDKLNEKEITRENIN